MPSRVLLGLSKTVDAGRAALAGLTVFGEDGPRPLRFGRGEQVVELVSRGEGGGVLRALRLVRKAGRSMSASVKSRERASGRGGLAGSSELAISDLRRGDRLLDGGMSMPSPISGCSLRRPADDDDGSLVSPAGLKRGKRRSARSEPRDDCCCCC